MQYLIALFYFFFVCIVLILAIFIVYHLRRYSIDKSFAQKQIFFFLLVGGTLLFLNILSFFFLPWQEMVQFLEVGTSSSSF
ncbi:MAG: hypothetical protein EOM19_04395 [Candidatus Moranbacteria bacterium]|nr:hypothetical protein [Candidatus Moranbacteria bacterium]